MTPSLFLSMALFALVTSITPGPVNIVALSSGAQYGFRASLRHVMGSALGFTLLLLLIGLGLHEALDRWPGLVKAVQWGGVAFLLFMAYRLAADDGHINEDKAEKGPSLFYGALMQWLNPKAWLASLAGMGFYAAKGEADLVWLFALIYFVVCYASVACWAYTGTFLRRLFHQPRHVRLFNRLMAALLAACALYLLWM